MDEMSPEYNLVSISTWNSEISSYTLCCVSQSCLALCSPLDCSPPSSSVHGIFQARVLQWVAIPFSRGSSRPRDQTCISSDSCTAGGFFTAEPPGEVPDYLLGNISSLYLFMGAMKNLSRGWKSLPQRYGREKGITNAVLGTGRTPEGTDPQIPN